MQTLRFLFAFFIALLLTTACEAAGPKQIKLGVVTTPGTAQYIAAEHFKEIFEEKTAGAYEVVLYHSGSLGSETEILQQIRMNAVQMGIITLGPFDAFVPEVKVVAFPFLFKDHAQADALLDGPLGEEVLGALSKVGLKGLAFSENGFRCLTNDRQSVKKVADVRGLKIRVMESSLHKELWRTLGANPTPMAWPIYTELAQGTIDGQENPLSIISLYKLYEVQKHLSLTNHVYSAHISTTNLAWFSRLPKDVQEAMRLAAREAAKRQRSWNRENREKFLAELEAKGMEIVAEPDLAGFKEKVQGLKDMPIYGEAETAALLERFLKASAN